MADEQALHEALERDAYADFWAAAPAGVRAACGLAHRRIGDGVLLTGSGLDGSLLFNRLAGYGIAGARAEDLDDAIRTLTGSGVRTWTMTLIF